MKHYQYTNNILKLAWLNVMFIGLIGSKIWEPYILNYSIPK